MKELHELLEKVDKLSFTELEVEVEGISLSLIHI